MSDLRHLATLLGIRYIQLRSVSNRRTKTYAVARAYFDGARDAASAVGLGTPFKIEKCALDAFDAVQAEFGPQPPYLKANDPVRRKWDTEVCARTLRNLEGLHG